MSLSLLTSPELSTPTPHIPPGETKRDFLGAFGLAWIISMARGEEHSCSDLLWEGIKVSVLQKGPLKDLAVLGMSHLQLIYRCYRLGISLSNLLMGCLQFKKQNAERTQRYCQKELLPYSLFSCTSGRVNKSTLNLVEETCSMSVDKIITCLLMLHKSNLNFTLTFSLSSFFT